MTPQSNNARRRRAPRTRVVRSTTSVKKPVRKAAPKRDGGSLRESIQSASRVRSTRRATSAKPAHNNKPRKTARGGTSRGRRRERTPLTKPTHTQTGKKITVPPVKDNVRIIPLGGVEEVGRNMTAIEVGNDILVIDAGFQFKDEGTPGIDYILPNTQYLEENKDRIRGMLVTHGHLDHIGGIPYIMERIGNPTIYTRNLTGIMIQKRQAEFPQLDPIDIQVVEKNGSVTLGDTKIRFFAVTHTIPDSMGFIIETPYGVIVIPSDFKLTHVDGVVDQSEIDEYKIFEKENVLLMMSDSTNIENPGFSTPESEVHKGFEVILRENKGRMIIGTFASQLERLIKIIEIAESFNKKIVIEGRSMKTNMEIAELAGLFKPKKGTIIPTGDIDKYPPDKIVILATGAQGDQYAALMRIATKTHKYIRLNESDTVVFSSSVIPGNEKAVQKLKDNIARSKAKIVHYRTSEVFIHSTGHGNREEIRWLHNQVKPKFFIPIHGNHYHLRLHEQLAREVGMPKENIIVPDNGSVIDITHKGTKIMMHKEKAGGGMLMVDGFSIGNVQDVVIRDRQVLAEDGMFVIIATINSRTGKLRKSPDIISRGFVYLRESQDLLHQARIITKKSIEETTKNMNPINFDMLKNEVTDQVAKFLFQKTNKHPIVIPVLLGV